MGCDIHICIERKIDGVWTLADVRPEALAHRNYNVFAILADVRNGSGFAGIKTGNGFKPIAEPRGLPDDLCAEIRDYQYDDDHDEKDWGKNLGDHSFSWLTLREVLEYDYEQTTKETGVLGIKEFIKLERERNRGYRDEDLPRPDSWAGDISGPGVVHLPAAEARRLIESWGLKPMHWKDEEQILKRWSALGQHYDRDNYHIRDEWEIRYMQSMKSFICGLTKYIKFGMDDVRLVLGFDS
jgi:hypothetical protein